MDYEMVSSMEMNRNSISKNKKEKRLIFSFAGGGTDGIGSLEILKILDKKLKEKSKGKIDILDILNSDNSVLAGTSTGSIIASLIKNKNRINPDTGKKYTIEDFQKLYMDVSPQIFTPSYRMLFSCCMAPFSRDALVEVSKKHLQDQKIRDVPGLLITAFNKTESEPDVISDISKYSNYLVRESAEASAAIPCAFSPKIIGGTSYSDGGSCLVSLHPTIEVLEYYKNKGYTDDVLIVDIGAGSYCDTPQNCISPVNFGGICATLLDGTLCECVKNIQKYPIDITKNNKEPFMTKVYEFNFPATYPLAYTDKCLLNTIDVARTSISGDQDTAMNELVDDIIRWF